MVYQHFMLVNHDDVVQNIILGYEQASGGVIAYKAAREKIEKFCNR